MRAGYLRECSAGIDAPAFLTVAAKAAPSPSADSIDATRFADSDANLCRPPSETPPLPSTPFRSPIDAPAKRFCGAGFRPALGSFRPAARPTPRRVPRIPGSCGPPPTRPQASPATYDSAIMPDVSDGAPRLDSRSAQRRPAPSMPARFSVDDASVSLRALSCAAGSPGIRPSFARLRRLLPRKLAALPPASRPPLWRAAAPRKLPGRRTARSRKSATRGSGRA